MYKTSFLLPFSNTVSQAKLEVIEVQDVEKAVLEKEADVGLIEEYTSSQSKVVVVTSYASGTSGDSAASYLNSILPLYREQRIKDYLSQKGINEDVFSLVVVQSKQVGEPMAICQVLLGLSGFTGHAYQWFCGKRVPRNRYWSR